LLLFFLNIKEKSSTFLLFARKRTRKTAHMLFLQRGVSLGYSIRKVTKTFLRNFQELKNFIFNLDVYLIYKQVERETVRKNKRAINNNKNNIN
jgi:hypothetical protein